jgi:plastocyanin
MRESQRYLWTAVSLLLVGAIVLVAGLGRANSTVTQRVAQHYLSATATATDLPIPTSTTAIIQVIVTLGPTPAILPGDSSAITPTTVPASSTNTPVPPTPTSAIVPPTATPTATAGPQAIVITIENTTPPGAFTPQTRTVPHGSTVIWHNNTGLTHTATSVSGPASFDTGLIASGTDSAAITFITPGTYQYHCSIHPSMVGTLIVT